MTGASIMPPSVAAAHLEACAAALAGANFFDPDDVLAVIPILARAQRQLAAALTNISDEAVGGEPRTARVLGTTIEWTELSEVVTEAAAAAAATADALDEALPLLDYPDDTRS